jgi:curli biogenesis system outer membrane secretion channel CsgG
MRGARCWEISKAKRKETNMHHNHKVQVRHVRIFQRQKSSGLSRVVRIAALFMLANCFLLQTSFAQSGPKNGTATAAPVNASTNVNNGQPSPDKLVTPKLRLAVMDLNGSALKTQVSMTPSTTTTTVAIPPPADFARGMTEMLTTALTNSGKFIVLERTAMDKVTAEQDFGNNGRVNKETAAKQGQVIGAQALITGDITEFSYTQSSYGGNFSLLQGLGAKLDKVAALVGIDIRVVDATTGQVLASQHAQGKANMSGVSASLTQTGRGFNIGAAENTPLGHATRQALEGCVDAITKGMQRQRWSARVIDFRDELLYVNAGADIGLKPGAEFEVYRPQDVLVDPETGIKLGVPERKVGTVIVDSVEPSYCVAKVTSGSGFKRGDVIRLKGDIAQP